MFLTLLRFLAMSMIVWDHLGPFHNPEWRIGQLVENCLNRPLGIVQSFGGIGVVLFFLISGFLMGHEAGRGSRARVAVQKIIRLYPPLVVSFASFYLVQRLVTYFTGQNTWWTQFSPRQWLLGGTLANYVVGEADVINGTTWFLFPTLLFFALCVLLYPWLKTRPALSIVVMEALLAAGYGAVAWVGTPALLRNVLELAWYIGFLLCGLLLYNLWSGRIGTGTFLVLGAVDYLLLLKGIVLCKPSYYEESPYLISFAYALLLFALALTLEGKLRSCAPVNALSKISYSVYLVHMPYGSLLLTLLAPQMGYTFAFAATLVLVTAVAVLHYLLAERPIARLFSKPLREDAICRTSRS
ncbi:MAG: acyltransferase [Oscillospiraceae bacterium]